MVERACCPCTFEWHCWRNKLWFVIPFFENLGSYVYDSMRARVRFCFWKASAQRFSRWEVVRHARACSRCACACPRRARGSARDSLAALGVLGGSAAKWTNVVWPIKSRPTNRQTNKHTLLFYRYRWTTCQNSPWLQCETLLLQINFMYTNYLGLTTLCSFETLALACVSSSQCNTAQQIRGSTCMFNCHIENNNYWNMCMFVHLYLSAYLSFALHRSVSFSRCSLSSYV